MRRSGDSGSHHRPSTSTEFPFPPSLTTVAHRITGVVVAEHSMQRLAEAQPPLVHPWLPGELAGQRHLAVP